ncbi:hypothetical protein MKW98_008829 [Papaver atlanticum]|uniref:Uncharacterized protein n=1 Tax=Papaver atlanticum TaxID=357466 RepID=A0AAD4S6H1_9MAGN|nr:hypothetical protein MKW98_008829 [Papaver atlanticum]
MGREEHIIEASQRYINTILLIATFLSKFVSRKRGLADSRYCILWLVELDMEWFYARVFASGFLSSLLLAGI